MLIGTWCSSRNLQEQVRKDLKHNFLLSSKVFQIIPYDNPSFQKIVWPKRKSSSNIQKPPCFIVAYKREYNSDCSWQQLYRACGPKVSGVGRGFLLKIFFGIVELRYRNFFRYLAILKILILGFLIFNSIKHS